MADKIRAAALEAAPAEACGILAICARCCGTPRHFREIKNMSTAEGYYEMEPDDQLEAWREVASQGGTVCAVWHSHPTQPAIPSPADREAAVDQDVIHLICSPTRDGSEQLRAWRNVGGDAMTEVPIHLV
jgi:proteasome lid subunit RPN8/RPN11